MATSNNISILITAKDEATKVLSGLGVGLQAAEQRAGGFSASLARIRDVALGVYLPQLAMQFASVGKNAINSAGDFEQYRVAFETMLGSADKARVMLQNISDFAKTTPFQLPEVVQASKQLLAFGFAQEQVLPTLRKLGDVAAGVGVPVGQLAFVYGQVRLSGKLMAQDLMQFTNAGVPMLDYLSQVMHKTTAQIKQDMDRGVSPSFDQVQKALDLMTQNGSKFGGMMDKQSHTLKGVASNIADSFGQILRSAVGISNTGEIVKGSFFDRIKDAANAAMPALQRFAEQVGPAMQRAMDTTSAGVVAMVKAFHDGQTGGEGFVGFMEHVGAIAKAVVDAFDHYLLPSLKSLYNTVKDDLGPELKKLVPYMDDVAKFAGAVLVGSLWVLINVLNIVAHVLSDLIDWFFKVKSVVEDVGNFIGTKFEEAKRRVTDAFSEVRTKLAEDFDYIKDHFAEIIGEIIGKAATLPIRLQAIGLEASIALPKYLLSIDWYGVFSRMISAGLNGLNILKANFQDGFALMANWAVVGVESIKDDFLRFFRFVQSINWSAAFYSVTRSFGNAIVDMINGALRGAFSDVPVLKDHVPQLPHFENGVRNFQGGWAVVGDVNGQGGEIVKLPAGSDVYSNAESKQMMGSGVTIQNMNINNNVDPMVVVRQIGWALATR